MSLTIGDIEQHATDLDAYILAGLDAVALEGEGAEIYRATTGNDGFVFLVNFRSSRMLRYQILSDLCDAQPKRFCSFKGVHQQGRHIVTGLFTNYCASY